MNWYFNQFLYSLAIGLIVIIIIRLMMLEVRDYHPHYEPRTKQSIDLWLNNSNYQTSLNFCIESEAKQSNFDASGHLFDKNNYQRAGIYQFKYTNKILNSLLVENLILPCLNLKTNQEFHLKLNRYLIVSLVFLLSLLSWIITRNWLTPLVVAAALLSSSLIWKYNEIVGFSNIGRLYLSALLIYAFNLSKNLKLEKIIIFLLLSSPLVLLGYAQTIWAIAWLPLLMPYKKNYKHIFVILISALTVLTVTSVYLLNDQIKNNVLLVTIVELAWGISTHQEFLSRLIVCFAIFILCNVISDEKGLPFFRKFSRTLTIMLLGLITGSVLLNLLNKLNFLYFDSLTTVEIFEWSIPAFLTYGIIGFTHLLLILKNNFFSINYSPSQS